MKAIPYGHQHITEEDIAAVVETLRSDYLTQGSKVPEFEKQFAAYTGAKYAAAVSSGTAALHLSAMALGVKPGDRVIVTPMTFAASANCVKYCGGEVVFCDIDKHSYLLDLEQLRRMLAEQPKGYYTGVIAVDYAGYPLHSENLRRIADEYGLWIIEDACHAPGAWFTDSKGKKQLTGNGSFADLTVFSFHPVKHITTGEGGMITTNSKALYDHLTLLRSHGISKDPEKINENHGGWYYEEMELGYNYRLTDFQAALGISQLKRVDAGLERRQEIAGKYTSAFKDYPGITVPTVEEGVYHAYHLYVIQVEDRLGLYNHLKENNIYAQVHYEPVHLQPYYRRMGNKPGDMPVAEDLYRHCLSLPMFSSLTDEEQEYVVEKVKEFFFIKKEKNDTPKISIIIGVYNTEQYLRECLDSLINQTLKDIEIICVNDASTDSSLDILLRYKQKDKRIKIINFKENKKLGAARNAGIQIARGEYISFFDSDDWAAFDFYSALWNASNNGSIDLVSSDYYIYKNGEMIPTKRFPDHIMNLSKDEQNKYFLLHGWFAWPAMLRRRLFFEYGLFYHEGIFGEDVALGAVSYCVAHSIIKVNIPLYYYRVREYSITNSTKSFPVLDYHFSAMIGAAHTKRLGLYDKYKEEIEARFYRYYYRQPLLSCFTRFSEPQKDYIDQIKKNFIPYRDSRKYYSAYYHNYDGKIMRRKERLGNMFIRIVEWNTDISILIYKSLRGIKQIIKR